MFVYSLAGLEVEGEAAQDVEIEENETTARSAVYQLLARLMSPPDAEAHAAAVAGEWPGRLREAGGLLPFAFEPGEASLDSSVSAEDHQAEYLRLFDVGAGTEGPPAPIVAGAYGGERMQRMEEVVRFYEYFGLRTSAEDPRPADHLCTELEFMQYLTFKEAASSSPRLQASFRRAQHDFLGRQLDWLPELQRRTDEAQPSPFWQWSVGTVASFIGADATHVEGLLG